MKKIKLSLLDREVLGNKLKDKHKELGSLIIQGVDVFQLEDVNNSLITTVSFYYGFFDSRLIQFRYYNEELFTVTGDDVQMRFIDEMKNLLKEIEK